MSARAKPSRRLKILGFLLLSVTLVGGLAGGIGYLYFSRHLPSVDDLKSDHFPTVSEVYDDNGEVIGEYYVERRYILPYDRIPKGMVDAITSAEDADFFEHGGVDYVGIFRAALRNAEEGEVVQGASTITMQLAKSLLVQPEGRWSRKFKQVILAKRLEGNFSKEEILDLYLNNVFFGRGAYGVEGAAREYFGKHLDQLDTAQFAMIAGLPKAPSTFSAADRFQRWKDRQEWILDREAKLGKITQGEADAAKAEPIVIQPKHDANLDDCPYFVEYVRQQLQKTYGEDAVYKGGLAVYTTADAKMCRAATKSVQNGLRGLDKHQGWRGPIKNVDRAKWPEALADLDAKRDLDQGKTLQPDERVQGLVVAVDAAKGRATIAYGPDWEKSGEKGTLLIRDASWARPPDPTRAWNDADVAVTNIGKVVKPGDVVWIEPKTPSADEIKQKAYPEGESYVTLEQEPLVQGSLLAMDPQSGAVKAMVGGYDFAGSEYNRATQSRRQPGSSFKPVVYSAAVDKGYTPSTILQDSPIVFADQVQDPSVKDADTGDEALDDGIWKPKNYGEKYYGDTTFRTALVLSRNIPTIRIVQDIGVDYVAEYAKNLGYSKEPNHDLSIALGSSDISLVELASIYSTFPAQGKKVDPYYVKRVVARDGSVLEWHAPDKDADRAPLDVVGSLGSAVSAPAQTQTHYDATYPEDKRPGAIDDQRDAILRAKGLPPGTVMDPGTAYVLTDLMKHVVLYGTGTGANLGPGRPVAGKTGTTNDETDVWFMGFTPDLVAGVWVGFDDPKKPLGKAESGGHSAVPIWTNFMIEAVKELPARDFPQPPGIVRVQVDRETGLRACPDTESPVWVAFKEGTEPVDYVCHPGSSGLPLGITPTNGTGVGNVPSGLPPE